MKMNTNNKGKLIGSLLLSSVFGLAACGGDSSSSNSGGAGGGNGGSGPLTVAPIAPQPLIPGVDDAGMAMTYPVMSSREVPITIAPTVRYNESVNDVDHVLGSSKLFEGSGSSAVEVATTLRLADQGRTVILTPEENLKPNTYHSLNYLLASGTVRVVNFTTGGDPASDDIEARSLDVAEMNLSRIYPHNDLQTNAIANDLIENTSVIRLIHSQPIDPETVRYAEDGNIKLVQGDDETFVEANVVISDRTIIIDPIEDMPTAVDHEVIYESNNADAIHSIYGQPYNPSGPNTVFSIYSGYNWTPGWPEGIPGEVEIRFGELQQNSPWTDWLVNELAGDAEAILNADLSTTPGFPGFYPAIHHFRIHNSALSGDQFVPVARNLGDDAGVIEVTFPTDLTGYMGQLSGALQMRAFVQVDIALDGGEPQSVALDMAGFLTPPNGPDDDVVIELLGAVDPALLGQERTPGNGMVTFQFRVPLGTPPLE